jgi:hypothetical protein
MTRRQESFQKIIFGYLGMTKLTLKTDFSVVNLIFLYPHFCHHTLQHILRLSDSQPNEQPQKELQLLFKKINCELLNKNLII